MINTSCIKKFAANESGATSILIIFMMLILVALGAFAITSANVNYKLSKRSLEWNVMYFALDAKGEEYLYVLDGKLAEAESAAYAYVKDKKYQTTAQAGIPSQIQGEIYKKYQSGGDTNSSVKEIFEKIYMHYASTYINEVSANYSDFELSEVKKGNKDSIINKIVIKSDTPGSEMCSLHVSVAIEPVEYTASGSSSRTLRYKITEWSENQEPESF